MLVLFFCPAPALTPEEVEPDQLNKGPPHDTQQQIVSTTVIFSGQCPQTVATGNERVAGVAGQT